MSTESHSRSALADLYLPGETSLQRGHHERVLLAECPDVALAILRLPAQAGTAHQAIAEAVGVPLPKVPNTVGSRDGLTILWLSPDEWLLRADPAAGADWAARCEAALADQNWFAVTDQSSAYSVLQLAGPQARDVLNAGCPLDLHPRALAPGQCAQTLFFKFSIVLRPLTAAGDAWEVLVRRSHADALVRMVLADDYFL